MKLKHGIVALAAIAMAAGVGAGVAAANGIMTLETKAADTWRETTMFVDISDVSWDNYIVRIWNNEDVKFVIPSVADSNLLKFTMPSGYFGIIVLSAKDANPDENWTTNQDWSNVASQTVDVWYDPGYNTIKVLTEKEGDKYSVDTSYAVKPISSLQRDVAAGTKRYWFLSDDSNLWSSQPKLGVKIISGAYDEETILCDSIGFKNDTTGFDGGSAYYIDLPSDATNIQVLRLNPTPTNGYYTAWNVSAEVNMADTAWINMAAANWLNMEDGKVKVSTGSVWNLTPAVIASILQEFPTCNIDAATVGSIYTNFIEHANGDLASATLAADFSRDDYKGSTGGHTPDTYTGITQKTNIDLPTAQEKWEAMCEVAGVNPENGTPLSPTNFVTPAIAENDSTPIIVSIVSATIVITTASFFFLRRKKEN